MNEQIKQLWDRAASLEPDPTWQDQVNFMERFANLVVDAACQQVLATDTRDIVYTTFDRDLVMSALSRAAKQLKESFGAL